MTPTDRALTIDHRRFGGCRPVVGRRIRQGPREVDFKVEGWLGLRRLSPAVLFALILVWTAIGEPLAEQCGPQFLNQDRPCSGRPDGSQPASACQSPQRHQNVPGGGSSPLTFFSSHLPETTRRLESSSKLEGSKLFTIVPQESIRPTKAESDAPLKRRVCCLWSCFRPRQVLPGLDQVDST